jgi:chromosome segregation ATPase
MKKLLVNLLILLALALCGLCAYQWLRETEQRRLTESLYQTIYERERDIQGYTNSIRLLDRQVAQLDGQVTDLRRRDATNTDTIFLLRRETNRLDIINGGLAAQLDQYSNAVEGYKAQITNINEGIKKQNAALKDLVAERDEIFGRLNEMIKDRNKVVEDYNELVKRVEQMQQEAAAPKTNAK